MKFFAKLQGVDLDKKAQESKMFFKDPNEYKDLSDEEKSELTQEMLNSHKSKIG